MFAVILTEQLTGIASHRAANRYCLSWARLLGGVNNSANTTSSNEKV